MPSYLRQGSLGNRVVYFPVLQQALQQEQVIHWSVDCLRSRQPSRRVGKCGEEYHSTELLDKLFLQPEQPSQHQELGNSNRWSATGEAYPLVTVPITINTKMNI